MPWTEIRIVMEEWEGRWWRSCGLLTDYADVGVLEEDGVVGLNRGQSCY